MRESILTIPISELFDPKEGCPICRMHEMLEQRTVEYCMGAAMMEPDVRIETNRLGFCHHHLHKMMKCNNRLSLALMLQTHLDTVRGELFERRHLFGGMKMKKERLSRFQESCFVCDKIDWGMRRLFVTMFELYGTAEFRDTFREQDFLCLHHYDLLLAVAPEHLKKPQLGMFEQDCAALVKKQLDLLYDDVSHFCRMYDYRNTGADADWGNSRDSIERSVKFLTGRD